MYTMPLTLARKSIQDIQLNYDAYSLQFKNPSIIEMKSQSSLLKYRFFCDSSKIFRDYSYAIMQVTLYHYSG